MPSFSSLSLLKTRLDISATTYDQALLGVLDGVEAAVITYLGYDPRSQASTVYLDGDGTDVLPLPRPYATAVTSVSEDAGGYYGQASDSFDSTTALTLGEHYATKNVNGYLTLIRIGTVWPVSRTRPVGRLGWELSECRGCVKVVFTSGLSPAQMAEVTEAVYMEAAGRWAMRNGVGPVTSSSLDGRSVGVTVPQPGGGSRGAFVNPVVKDMLAPLRRIPIAG